MQCVYVCVCVRTVTMTAEVSPFHAEVQAITGKVLTAEIITSLKEEEIDSIHDLLLCTEQQLKELGFKMGSSNSLRNAAPGPTGSAHTSSEAIHIAGGGSSASRNNSGVMIMVNNHATVESTGPSQRR